MLPPSFLKLVNELLIDVIDVTGSSNSEIIKKSVAILKIFADFIINEKKKLTSEEELKMHAEEQKINSPRLAPL